MAISSQDYAFMARALRLAERGLYTTDPNPRVGCVLVKNGEIVGEGWHERAGEGHAEVNALRAAGDSARGADCYVTLEPCSHHGRTPPCAEALVKAGVRRVVAAMEDPNPSVAGKGLALLRNAGIEAHAGCMAAEADELNIGFFQRMRAGRPWVRVKVASSLDGRSALLNGVSKWITGGAAREDVQKLRARSSAIITGIGTVIADDPSLNVRSQELERICNGKLRQPLRVVLDSQLRFPADSKMLKLPGKILLVTCADVPESWLAQRRNCEADFEVLKLTGENGRVDLTALLSALAARECNEVLVEAGANLAGAFVAQGLADEIWTYIAPKLMGEGRSAFALPCFDQMDQVISLKLNEVRQVGDDVRMIWRKE
ncbi:bifunctional diaminohydroxyphosphoribosylaminopyrimidine deaminase/5-amino-6-(5-phosphoribosylamino)uracil reductase RibD [Hahella sp. HN01]|uniref:bifunctional diaminohydroxyphosphoribosylaminopyrimidine deaminase/5-amino-6-(5-phosphoribosylamino)uracil reductase RibD n=1 Tax=Hahella sp. HN01 TaxID=2847262 RepID=UPI001C1EC02B|nr:bifunctional diaminohydroxyphosphoribosylaminopyrimidine deaminase/5-amino-6-(5-phosphoribosylamino)uracil reductase RibD [Hahella sp. HN01]MBU6953953.1 bifunctional diaminohydroxyphosphoribosylaminopyrimidine deaminase/5-amino-6-(5-phosphoribosylamino)uracil reductase RibD [Hahella sp. HN01]